MTSSKKVRGLKFNTCLQQSNPQYASTELSVALAVIHTAVTHVDDHMHFTLLYVNSFLAQ